jgi:ADP-ribose pyrophosphatase YjhB (NUDIX family)
MDSTELVNLRCSAIVARKAEILLLRRDRNGRTDWVLPGGTPRPRESMASCARREVAEETGLVVGVGRVAFVLEAANPGDGIHRVDLIFTTVEQDRSKVPRHLEPDLTPVFVPLAEVATLSLRPPIAGHLRGLHGNGWRGGAAYLGNLWRPAAHQADCRSRRSEPYG